MTLGERIQTHRKRAGLSQEQLAERVGVSRQAVTKWESGKSTPGTGHLFRLAEVFGTTVDRLLSPEDAAPPAPPAPQAPGRRIAWRERLRTACLAAAGYLLLYLIGRVIWCRTADASLLGWLWSSKPAGAHSYLYGWLLSSGLFWWAAAVSVLPALFGKRRFPWVTMGGFLLGMLAGILLGPNPAGAPYGHGDAGWAFWGGGFLWGIVWGILIERAAGRGLTPGSRRGKLFLAVMAVSLIGMAGLVWVVAFSGTGMPFCG